MLKTMLLVCVLLTLISCDSFFEPTEPYQRMMPPEIYSVWWSESETCADQRRDMKHVVWFTVAADSFLTRKGWAIGYWSGEHKIYLTERRKLSMGLVKHEMLHEIIHQGEHPSPPFRVCA